MDSVLATEVDRLFQCGIVRGGGGWGGGGAEFFRASLYV